MSDLGHRLTDKELAKLERKIKSVYSEASKDIQKTIDDFFYGYDKEVDGEIIHFNGFYERDEEMRKLLEAGKLVPNGASASMTPEEYYQQWRLNNLARGERFAAMRDKLAERATQANEVAISYVNDATPSIYSLNRNYAAYTIESVADNVSFTLYDESTVRRLLTEDPETMPYYPPQRAVKRGIDLEYGKKQITATVTSGILQGKSIPGLADSLQDRIISMSRTSAVRAARTAVTSAQNGGRQDSYNSAVNMGIRMKKEWMATLDARTRPEHGEADGQKVDVDKPFTVGSEKLMFPADPNGSGWNTYNCRCTMVADLLDYPDVKPRETYSEWIKSKEPNTGYAEPREKVLANPVQSQDDKYNSVLAELNANNVEYNPVHDHEKTLSDDEIIEQLGGGDLTQGSCASLALAYIGQRQGWNVLDFRDGTSRKTFARSGVLHKLSKMTGVKAVHYGDVPGKSSTTLAKNFLESCEVGKEYYLCTGRHASIVRKVLTDVVDTITGEVTGTKERLQYLELQSTTSGWSNFNGNPRYTLTQRFGCSSASGHGEKFDFMINITDSDFSTDEFRSLLGFINTEESKQRKGSRGTIK